MDTFKEEARDVLHRIDKESKIPVYYIEVSEGYIDSRGGDPYAVNETGVIFKKRDTKYYCLEDYYTGKPVNVKLWGVKGDGSRNDIDAFMKANKECEELNATLYFPKGIYFCNPKFSCSAKGETGARIVCVDSIVNIDLPVTIENIEFSGNHKKLNINESVNFVNCKIYNLEISKGNNTAIKDKPITFKDCEIYHTGTAIRLNGAKLVMRGNVCKGSDDMFMAMYNVDLEVMNNYIEAGTPIKVGEGGTNTGFVAFNVFKGQGSDIVGTIVQHSNITINAV